MGVKRGRLIGRTKGGLNTELDAVTDEDGRPVRFVATSGQVSDYKGTLALQSRFPQANWLIANRGYRRRYRIENHVRPHQGLAVCRRAL